MAVALLCLASVACLIATARLTWDQGLPLEMLVQVMTTASQFLVMRQEFGVSG